MKKILSCLAQFLNVNSVNNGLNPISSICKIVDEEISRFGLYFNSNYQGKANLLVCLFTRHSSTKLNDDVPLALRWHWLLSAPV